MTDGQQSTDTPAKPALPQDGACVKCGQTDHGQQGEYHCSECGLPTVWDER